MIDVDIINSLSSLAAFAEPGFEGGGIGAYLYAFGQGVLVDFTPCVYPLIPITVSLFGANENTSKAQALKLATAYVLGMAVFYTVLGVVTALSSAQFGAWLGDWRVVVPLALVMVALAASMFGAFELQLPAKWQTKLNTVGGAGVTGAFLMGLVSGLIAAPCTGPVLLGLLTFIASSGGGDVVYGGSLLFVYALGMGTLFFAVALGASLFRPGPFMNYIKSVFGIAMLVMAFYFLRNLTKPAQEFGTTGDYGLWLGVGLVALGVAAGAVHRDFHGPKSEKLIKGVGVAIATLGGAVALNNVLHVELKADWHKIETMAQLEAEIQAAEEADKPLLIDFGADWCVPCKEMETLTFSDEAVETALGAYQLVKIDVTDPSEEQEKMQAALHAETLPAVVVFGSSIELSAELESIRSGELVTQPTVSFNEFTPAEKFLGKLAGVE